MTLRTYAAMAFALCCQSFSFAQNQANIWYFGENAGLDFNNGSPRPLLDGQMSTLEGCATISNSNGQLLFYTDGSTVYNSNHGIMPNGTGLYGDSSSTHSAIIVPKPGSVEQYYIFTVDDGQPMGGRTNGLRYSIVDMAMNNGLGDVTTKNVQLVDTTSEKVVAYKIRGEDAYWVITQKHDSNVFMSFRVSMTGVSGVPVESTVGSKSTAGQIKISPDGKKLASATIKSLELFDFNGITGRVSNAITLVSGIGFYGTEFSPNGKLLYVQSLDGYFQFNLEAGLEEDIINSKFSLTATPDIVNIGSLQLGPDGRIYTAKMNSKYLSVIHNPDVLGTGCDFREDDLYLEGRKSLAGLPTFIANIQYLDGSIGYEPTCSGSPMDFSLEVVGTIDSIHWDFGDGNSSNEPEPRNTYANAGDYRVTVNAIVDGTTITVSEDITVASPPVVNTPEDIEVCTTMNFFGFDLSTLDDDVLGTQDPSLFELQYTVTHGDAVEIVHGMYNFPQGETTVEVMVQRRDRDPRWCSNHTQFEVVVKRAPEPQEVPDREVCSPSGAHTFALSGFDADILGQQDPSAFNIGYFASEEAARDGNGALGDALVVPSPGQTVHFRIENARYPECHHVGSFHLGVSEPLSPGTPMDMAACDLDGNGSEAFDLGTAATQILGGAMGHTVTFHLNQEDADSGTGALDRDHTAMVGETTIHARAQRDGDPGCYRTTSFKLVVSPPPVAPVLGDWTVCDGDGDGRHGFDLSEREAEILMGDPGQVSFHVSEMDAETGNAPIMGPYVVAGEGTVHFRLEGAGNADCYDVGSLQLRVLAAPVAHTPGDVSLCGDGAGATFDLSLKDAEVLGGRDTGTYLVSYHATERGAMDNTGPLPKEGHRTNSSAETVFARVQHSGDDGCYAIASFQLLVAPLPMPDLRDTYTLCPAGPGLVLDGGDFASHRWRGPDGNVLGEGRELTVNAVGDYSLTVTAAGGATECPGTRSFNVVEAPVPSDISVASSGISHTIALTITAAGSGDFEYSLDGTYYQSSNTFRVLPGPYTVYVRDTAGCQVRSKEGFAIGYPGFFSPNGDGTNDTWNVVGGHLDPTAQLLIYDRYGKFIHQVDLDGPGWDGTYRQRQLPATDYWFRFSYGQGDLISGHFALKR